ncbi:MAG TPA: FAD-binding oxidoreductase, partial [Burkholderiales bacterium]|nr:FAD-binding oxidoreductase [Burkholderiales bacterium]
MLDSLSAAFRDWASDLGPERVLGEAQANERYGPGTGGPGRVISGALIPQSVAEVVSLVRVAGLHRIPLYPISTGHNWGYGTAQPTRDHCVVVDLSKMNRIVDFDPALGVVSVEPGVTQGQLSRYLLDHHQPFMVPVTGAGPHCSLLGNALERGYGITPTADHFAAVMRLEAVLANGRLYRSALSEMGGDRIDKAYKWSIGPYLDGLFAQGNAGIVTQMTLALARRPERIEAFFFTADDASFDGLVEGVREVLGELPGITGAINLMNRRRVLAMTCPYPTGSVGPQGVLS